MQGKIRAISGLALLLCSAAMAGQADNPLGLRLHHFVAVVRDVDRTAQWYRETLGFRLDLRGSRADGRFQFADMSIPGFRATFVEVRDESGRALAKAGPRVPGTPGWARLTLAVPDPVALYAEMQKRGAKPRTRGSGPLNSFLINDLDGNDIEIVRIGSEIR